MRELTSNTKMKKRKKLQLKFASYRLIAVTSLLIVGLVSPSIVAASSITQQEQALEQSNAQAQQSVSSLEGQAATYQAQVNQLQAQITGLEGQISNTQNSINQVQAQIQANQIKLAQEKQTLDAVIKTMYVDGNLTTLEMLATSKTLSDFATKEEYQNIVQEKIQVTLAQINQTQTSLNQQNTQLSNYLSGLNAMNSQLGSAEAQAASLLSLNQAQQATYTQQLQANNQKLSALEAEQAAANAAEAKSVHVANGSGSGVCSIGQGTGPVSDNGIIGANYPDAWCNLPLDGGYDSNGILVRECTSFAYWYFVDVEGNAGFSPSGNAGWWWETSNYPVDTNPQVGAIGVEPSTATSTPQVPSLHDSSTGHVMIVTALPGQTYDGVSVPSGDVMVASMNEDEEGHFMYNLWPAADLWYIHTK